MLICSVSVANVCSRSLRQRALSLSAAYPRQHDGRSRLNIRHWYGDRVESLLCMSEIVCLREPARRTPDVSLALFPACPLAHSGRSYQNARNTIDGHSATPLRRRGDGVSTGLVVVVVAVSVVVIVVAIVVAVVFPVLSVTVVVFVCASTPFSCPMRVRVRVRVRVRGSVMRREGRDGGWEGRQAGSTPARGRAWRELGACNEVGGVHIWCM